LANQKQELRVAVMFLTHRDEISNLNRGLSLDDSYQVLVHLSKQFKRRFIEIGQSEKRIACGSHIC
jgi:uncharacterized protein YaeQ